MSDIGDGVIRAIFFDFGGVLARLDRELLAAYERRHGLPEGGFLKAMYTIPEWRDLEVGVVTEDAWIEAAKRKLDEYAGRVLPDITQERAAMWRTLDGDVLDLVRRLRERYRTGMISNTAAGLEPRLREAGIADLFDVRIGSGDLGIAKPDARIYHLAAERIGVEPSACVHIDDLEHNVEGARQAGFYGILHTGDVAALQRELRSLGVSW